MRSGFVRCGGLCDGVFDGFRFPRAFRPDDKHAVVVSLFDACAQQPKELRGRLFGGGRHGERTKIG